MDKSIRISIICFSFLMLSLSGLCSDGVNEYKIKVNKKNLRKIEVEANLKLNGSVLSMDWPSANSVENGWAHFVEILDISDNAGNSISYGQKAKASWDLPKGLDEVRVNYVVNIMHDYINWEEGGHSASAYVLADVVYMIGAALFVAAPIDAYKVGMGDPAHVTFDLPEDFDIAVPWEKSERSRHCFAVASTSELVRSAISFGNLRKSILDMQGMRIEIATASDFEEAIAVFKNMYEEIVPASLSYFGSAKDQTYTVIANRAPRTESFQPYFSAEALHQSMSIISPALPEAQFLSVFWYILAHEYIHNWNGISIVPEDVDGEYWFTEGFTDYIAWGLTYASGKIPLEIFLNGVELGENGLGWGVNIRKYLAVAGEKSMREAGKSKQENYDLIYSGGSLFALLLDIELRLATKGEKGLPALMKTLNRSYGGGGKNRLLGYRDLIREASELCDKDLSDLFEKYVNGKAVMSIEAYLGKLGLKIQDLGQEGQQIGLDPNAGVTAKQLREAILGGAQEEK